MGEGRGAEVTSQHPASTGRQISLTTNHRPLKNGGERGIRTLGRVTPTHDFQSCPFDHSGISPVRVEGVENGRAGNDVKFSRATSFK